MTEASMPIERLQVPPWVQTYGPISNSELGAQGGWSWALADVWRALAAPSLVRRAPAFPTRPDPHEQHLGYWFALAHLLRYRLGWTDFGAGLRWWYDEGKPAEEPTLALVKEIWDADGDLDWFVAWATSVFESLGDGGNASPSPTWSEWSRRVLDRQSSSGYPWLGSDPLHLLGHLRPTEDGGPGSIHVIQETSRTALFACDSAQSWSLRLAELAPDLPAMGDRSWKVDVYARPIGFMGTFRQSRVSGEWFVGRHRTHMAGNPHVTGSTPLQ